MFVKPRTFQLESVSANVIERLVVQDVALVGVFYQLVEGQCGVIGLYHCFGHLYDKLYAQMILEVVVRGRVGVGWSDEGCGSGGFSLWEGRCWVG